MEPKIEKRQVIGKYFRIMCFLTSLHSLGEARERDNIWELTKRIIFVEGALSE